VTDKTWKAIERRIARYIHGERVPVTGRQRGSAPDIKHAWLAPEVKHRKKLPDWIHDAMSQAKASVRGHQMPAVFLHEKGAQVGDCYVIVMLSDFKDRWL
jgi:hypothetical protein